MMNTGSSLSSHATRALLKSLASIAEILRFQVLELWLQEEIELGKEKQVTCAYSYNAPDGNQNSPKIRDHNPTILSQMEDLLKSAEKYYWTTSVRSETKLSPMDFPAQSEFAYLITPQTIGNVPNKSILFLFGYSYDQVPYSLSKLKFLSGIGSAIAIAYYEFDDDENQDQDECGRENSLFSQSRISSGETDPDQLTLKSASFDENLSAANLAIHFNGNSEILQGEKESFRSEDDCHTATDPTTSSHSAANEALQEVGDESENIEPTVPVAVPVFSFSELKLDGAGNLFISTPDQAMGLYSPRSDESNNSWQSTAPYSYRINEISLKHVVANDLTLSDFEDVHHFADERHSNIYVAKLERQRVIVKMIKEKHQFNPTVAREFDLEFALLCRIDHPNIIKVLGAGRQPRRFIVLEFLEAGTLNALLIQNQVQPGLGSKLFRKPSFSDQELLIRARELADALDYLHRRCHVGASILHRDLKPDNIGFAHDGSFKLIDFGLATCVKSRLLATDTYRMTGYTGSLRYMAPEVAVSAPYNEKVDVYSFGILLWQMARDKIPFKGLNKEEFMRLVVMNGERPKLDFSWPPEFINLLTSCWDKDFMKRPSFEQIIQELDKQLAILKATSHQPSMLKSVGKQISEPSVLTSWF